MNKNLKIAFSGTILSLVLFTNCTSVDNKDAASTVDSLHPSVNTAVADNRATDSVALTSIVRALYKLHETNPQNDFPLKFNHPGDSIFIGIDWDAYDKSMAVYKKTNFFSDNFFTTHRRIASSIDSSIKQSTIEWRNINDGIPV